MRCPRIVGLLEDLTLAIACFAALPDQEPINCTTLNPWKDERGRQCDQEDLTP